MKMLEKYLKIGHNHFLDLNLTFTVTHITPTVKTQNKWACFYFYYMNGSQSLQQFYLNVWQKNKQDIKQNIYCMDEIHGTDVSHHK